MRHKIFGLAILMLGACGSCLATNREAAAPAATGQWLTSVKQASDEARNSNRLILADFTGSDWCFWCKKLRSEVFETAAFKDWAAKHVVLLELDFPRTGGQDDATRKQNREMMQKYGVTGFPTVLFLKPDGASVGKMGYEDGGPNPWIAKAQKIVDGAK